MPVITSAGGVIALLSLVLLGGCADMSKKECLVADWRVIGERDAMAGRTADLFLQHADACQKNGIAADRSDYLTGHRQGQLAFCTPNRGRDDAMAGQPSAPVCAGVATPYDAAYASGLTQFCTVPNGLDWGRRGVAYRNVCPSDLVGAFQLGYGAGKEIFDLQARLNVILKSADDERKSLAEGKLTPEQRDAANRHLGQLDSDERATRRLIRDAERSAQALPRTGQ